MPHRAQRQKFPFDYYVRAITTAVLAMAIVGAGIYAIVIEHSNSQVIVAWASGVIGVYFGYHISRNGSEATGPPIDSQVTVRKEPESVAAISVQRVDPSIESTETESGSPTS